MKLHLALAGLGLLFPFAIVAEDEVIIEIDQDKECLVTYPSPEECLDRNPNFDGANRGRSLVDAAANDSASDHPSTIDSGRSLREGVFTVEAGVPIGFLFDSTTTQDFCDCTCGSFGRFGEAIHLFPRRRQLRLLDPNLDTSSNMANIENFLLVEAQIDETLNFNFFQQICFGGFPVIDDIGDNNDNDFFLTGLDGTSGSNFLTSTSILPLCPSTVTFDFEFAFVDFGMTKPKTLTLEVIDTFDKVILSVKVDAATLLVQQKVWEEPKTEIGGYVDIREDLDLWRIEDPFLKDLLITKEDFLKDDILKINTFREGLPLKDVVEGSGSASINLEEEGFKFCANNLRLRFNWNIPESKTGPAQFVLDNVVVTPTVSTFSVVVNEIADQNAGSASDVCNGEDYIELKNLTPNSVDLNGFTLSVDGTKNIIELTDVIIAADAFFLLCKFTGVTGGRKLLTDGGSVPFDVKSGLAVTLSTPFGVPVSSTGKLPAGDGTTSYQRNDDGTYQLGPPTPNQDTAPQFGPSDISGQGDPHFKAWRGQHYDFMGECDLVFLQSKDFESALGLDVHIRTKLRRDMSYIASAALRIGKDLLEVESQGVYWLNGVLNADLPEEFSGFSFSHTQPTDKQHVFEVYLGGRERIKLKTYKDFVSVLIEQGKSEHFLNSVGLMGDFAMGRMIARDGKTVIDDANAFGQEWQVRDTEPSLFQTARLPQHPNVCTMPTPVQASHLRRRLLETSSVDELAAERACAHWGEQGKDDCVFDVLTTGDLEMAMVGAY